MRTIRLAAIAIALSLLGCGATPTRRSPGEAFDDVGITARVKTRIARDAGVGEAAEVNVDTYRGNVSLAGFVDTPEQKAEAARAAAQASGVRKVDNNIRIKPGR
jgi:hyperosmotically inducible protein